MNKSKRLGCNSLILSGLPEGSHEETPGAGGSTTTSVWPWSWPLHPDRYTNLFTEVIVNHKLFLSGKLEAITENKDKLPTWLYFYESNFDKWEFLLANWLGRET